MPDPSSQSPASAAAPAPAASPATPKPAAPETRPAAAAKPGDKTAEGKPGEAPAAQPAKSIDHAAVAKAAHKLREEKRKVGEQVKALTDQHQAQLAPVLEELRKFREERAQWEADRKAALADPIAWAAKNGGTAPEQAIRGFVNAGTPEAAIAEAKREAAEAKAAAEELKQLRAKDAEDRKKEAEEADKRNRTNAEAAAVNGFVRNLINDAKKWPYVTALYTPEEIAAKAAEFQRLAQAEEWTDERGQKRVGKAYPFEVVANHFEKFAKAAYDKRQARLAELTASQEADPAPAAGIQVDGVPGRGRREKDGPQQEAPKRPKRPHALTREEEAIADKALLRKAFEEDAKARAVKH